MALHGDRRTRRAPGLEVAVRDGVAVLRGIVDPEVRDVAVKLAERTEGVKKVDDRMDEIRRRLDPPPDSSVRPRRRRLRRPSPQEPELATATG